MLHSYKDSQTFAGKYLFKNLSGITKVIYVKCIQANFYKLINTICTIKDYASV